MIIQNVDVLFGIKLTLVYETDTNSIFSFVLILGSKKKIKNLISYFSFLSCFP